MHLRKVMDRLMVLNPLENLAKQYHDALGKDLEYTKYVLLTRYAKTDIPPFSYICSQAFDAESEKLAFQFANQYRKN